MNRRRTGLSAILATMSMASIGLGVVLAGCGDDTEVLTPDAAATDASTVDVRKDSFAPEASADAPADTLVADAADAAPLPDAGPIDEWLRNQVDALCTRIASCCVPIDAGKVDVATCKSVYWSVGSVDGNGANYLLADGGASPLVARGKTRLDPVGAQACITSLKGFTCAAQSTQEWRALLQNCYGALSGTVAIGSAGCKDSAECVPGAYCEMAADGGEGTCKALVEAGAPCGTTNNERCSYRGYFGNLRCDLFKYGDAGGTKTCVAQQPTAAACNYQWECANDTCGFASSTCDSVQVFVEKDLCGALSK